MKVLRTASLGSNFTAPYKKKECSALCQNKCLLISLIEYVPANISLLFQRCVLVDTTSRCGAMSNQR